MTFLRTDVVQNKDNQVRHLRADTKERVPPRQLHGTEQRSTNLNWHFTGLK